VYRYYRGKVKNIFSTLWQIYPSELAKFYRRHNSNILAYLFRDMVYTSQRCELHDGLYNASLTMLSYVSQWLSVLIRYSVKWSATCWVKIDHGIFVFPLQYLYWLSLWTASVKIH